jgi:hypothetical protein
MAATGFRGWKPRSLATRLVPFPPDNTKKHLWKNPELKTMVRPVYVGVFT